MIRLIFSSPFFLCFFSPLQLELISSLRAKVRALEEDRELVLTEAKQCAERGEELEAAVRAACKPNELERYVMFIGDLEKVVSLLLCLSSRLARVQNAMRKIDGNTDAEEKVSVESTRYLISSVHVCPMGLHSPCFPRALHAGELYTGAQLQRPSGPWLLPRVRSQPVHLGWVSAHW